MSKFLVFGAAGQVGREMVEQLLSSGHQVIALARSDLDVCDEGRVQGAICDTGVEAVINCAAYTKVDKAETEEQYAYTINALAPQYMATACKQVNIPLIHLSTDYVLDTRTGRPHLESESPVVHNAYARTKLAGEQLIIASGCNYLIFRISWVFGRYGANFVKTMVKLAQTRKELSVVSDELGAPTPARGVALALGQIVERAIEPGFQDFGLYHFCGKPYCVRSDFARQIFDKARQLGVLDHEVTVKDILSKDYPSSVIRPLDSRLDCNKFINIFSLDIPKYDDYLEETIRAFNN